MTTAESGDTVKEDVQKGGTAGINSQMSYCDKSGMDGMSR